MQPSSAIDDSEAIDSRSQAFGAAVVPLHQDLELIGVEHGAAHADAHARPEELDPLALARYELSAVLFMTLSLPHVLAIGTRQSALDERSIRAER